MIVAYISVFVLMFTVAFLNHHFMDFMNYGADDYPEIQLVEVVNIGDLGRK